MMIRPSTTHGPHSSTHPASRLLLFALPFLVLLLLPPPTPAFELSDPRFRPSDPHDPSAWQVIDTHWLQASLSSPGGAASSVKLGHYFASPEDVQGPPITCSFTLNISISYSSLHWNVVSPCPDPDPSDPHDRECVAVPYAVDRVFKKFYLPTSRLLGAGGDDFVRLAARGICEQENLNGENCEHIENMLRDGVVQQQREHAGSDSTLQVDIVPAGGEPVAIISSRFPYPTVVDIPCQLVPPGHYAIRIGLVDHPGYFTGKRHGAPTEFSVALETGEGWRAGCEEQERALAEGGGWREPKEGGVYRTDVPLVWDGADEACVVVGGGEACAAVGKDRVLPDLQPGRAQILLRPRERGGEGGWCKGVMREIEVVDDAFVVAAALPQTLESDFTVNYYGHAVEGISSKLEHAELADRFAAAVPGVRNVTAKTFVTFSPTGEAVKQEMELSVRHRDLGELFGGKAPNLVFVTACDANYWRDGRLQNLVASIQTWEPGATIRFYAMGEEGEEGFRDMVRDASSWRSVQVLRVPDTIAIDGQIHATPPHMKHARKYAFKPAVIWDALGEVGRKEGAVFWIDAGAEIRRPVDGVREILRDTGFFSVEHAYKFPDQQFHHPTCVENLGCHAPAGSRQHCATTFLGFWGGPGGEEGVELLKQMVACAMDPECISPAGASRVNHRQEQTVMNAIMCAQDMSLRCEPVGKFVAAASFEHDRGGGPWVTAGAREWNDVELFTRRINSLKPYGEPLLG